jgi:hypothetical protein
VLVDPRLREAIGHHFACAATPTHAKNWHRRALHIALMISMSSQTAVIFARNAPALAI